MACLSVRRAERIIVKLRRLIWGSDRAEGIWTEPLRQRSRRSAWKKSGSDYQLTLLGDAMPKSCFNCAAGERGAARSIETRRGKSRGARSSALAQVDGPAGAHDLTAPL